jgi:hypothetical protein
MDLQRTKEQGNCQLPHHRYVVSIVDGDQTVASREHCARHGRNQAMFDIDARGRLYLLLAYAPETGSDSADYLRVYRLDGHELTRIFYTRISMEPAATESYHYDFFLRKPAKGGLVLNLYRKDEGDSAAITEMKRRTYRLDAPSD